MSRLSRYKRDLRALSTSFGGLRRFEPDDGFSFFLGSVKITAPQNNKKFETTDKIKFTCLGDDPDLLIPDTEEELTFRWFINHSDTGDLGTGSEFTLAKNALSPGFHNITVEVADSAGVKAFDYVQIFIKEAPKGTASTVMTGVYISIIILIIHLVLN